MYKIPSGIVGSLCRLKVATTLPIPYNTITTFVKFYLCFNVTLYCQADRILLKDSYKIDNLTTELMLVLSDTTKDHYHLVELGDRYSKYEGEL